MPFQRLRGTHDIHGEDAGVFRRVEREARKVFGDFGFEELRTPVMEEKELFTRALGQDTDVVQKEMYEFNDRSDLRIALRPEGTAGVVRAYIENSFQKTLGLAKFYYIGAMFRSERPQAGRLRQFHQIGVEQLGTDEPLADAETIHCLAVFLDKLGVRDYAIRLNNLGTFEERKEYREKLTAYFMPKKSSLCEDCQKRLATNVFRILDCKNETCRKVVQGAPKLGDHLTPESRAHHDKVKDALRSAGIAFSEDPYMVRGLDYYTKTVFEVSHPKLGAQDALAAGGRYDKLIESLGGSPAGAVGFALGIERLGIVLAGTEPPPSKHKKETVFVAMLGDEAVREGFKLAAALRRAGTSVLADFSARSLKSQMRLADKEHCRYVAILGEDELKKKKIVVKDMTDGSQQEVPLDKAVETLSKKAGSAC